MSQFVAPQKMISSRDISVISVMVLMSFIVENTIGLILVPIIGIPLVGGLASSLIDALLIFLGVYLVPRSGGALVFATLLLTLSSLTPSFGPPGIYKILIGLALGATVELTLMLLGRRDWVYVLAIAIVFGLSVPITYFVWTLFAIPGIDAVRGHIPLFMLLYTFLGGIGAFLGLLLYVRRLSRHQLVQRVRNGL